MGPAEVGDEGIELPRRPRSTTWLSILTWGVFSRMAVAAAASRSACQSTSTRTAAPSAASWWAIASPYRSPRR